MLGQRTRDACAGPNSSNTTLSSLSTAVGPEQVCRRYRSRTSRSPEARARSFACRIRRRWCPGRSETVPDPQRGPQRRRLLRERHRALQQFHASRTADPCTDKRVGRSRIREGKGHLRALIGPSSSCRSSAPRIPLTKPARPISGRVGGRRPRRAGCDGPTGAGFLPPTLPSECLTDAANAMRPGLTRRPYRRTSNFAMGRTC